MSKMLDTISLLQKEISDCKDKIIKLLEDKAELELKLNNQNDKIKILTEENMIYKFNMYGGFKIKLDNTMSKDEIKIE